jgi:hypothetical protein
MPRVGKLLRETFAADARFERRFPNPKDREAYRREWGEVGTLALADVDARFPGGITVENAKEVLAFQSERMAHHTAAFNAKWHSKEETR